MATTTHALTLDEFLALPEQKPAIEYGWGGEITQKPMGTTDHSIVQRNIIQLLSDVGVGSAYPELRIVLGGLARVPDVAFYVADRLPREQVPTSPPDVAIEVLSPEQQAGDLAMRCRWYVEQGVAVALLADPAKRTLTAFTKDGESTVRGAQTLSALGISLTADEAFRDILSA